MVWSLGLAGFRVLFSIFFMRIRVLSLLVVKHTLRQILYRAPLYVGGLKEGVQQTHALVMEEDQEVA